MCVCVRARVCVWASNSPNGAFCLARTWLEHSCSAVDDDGAYLIDRNPRYFEPLLGFLRDGTIILDSGVSARGASVGFGCFCGVPPFFLVCVCHGGVWASVLLLPVTVTDACCHVQQLGACAYVCPGVLAEAHFFGLWSAIEILEPMAHREVSGRFESFTNKSDAPTLSFRVCVLLCVCVCVRVCTLQPPLSICLPPSPPDFVHEWLPGASAAAGSTL